MRLSQEHGVRPADHHAPARCGHADAGGKIHAGAAAVRVRTAGGALMGHLPGGAPLYGAPVPADRRVRDAVRLRGRQRHHAGSGGDAGQPACGVGYRLPPTHLLHVSGQGVSGAHVPHRRRSPAARAGPHPVHAPHHHRYPRPAAGGGDLPRQRLRHRERRVQDRSALHLRAGSHRGGSFTLRWSRSAPPPP